MKIIKIKNLSFYIKDSGSSSMDEQDIRKRRLENLKKAREARKMKKTAKKKPKEHSEVKVDVSAEPDQVDLASTDPTNEISEPESVVHAEVSRKHEKSIDCAASAASITKWNKRKKEIVDSLYDRLVPHLKVSQEQPRVIEEQKPVKKAVKKAVKKQPIQEEETIPFAELYFV